MESILKISRVDERVVDVEHKEGHSAWFEKVDKEELKAKVHKFVDGKGVRLWSDNDYEEPSTIMYIAVHGRGISEVQQYDLGNLVYHLNSSETGDIYMVNFEDCLI